MKPFTVRHGKFTGEHIIYDSPSEFISSTKLSPKKWGSIDIKPDDWIISDDGFVAQCLHIGIVTNKINKCRTFLYRFCFGTRYCYETKTMGYKIPNFYIFLDFTKGKNAIGKSKYKDKQFGLHIEAGLTLEAAYEAVWKKKPTRFRLGCVIERNKGALMEAIQKQLVTITERVVANTGRTPAELADDALVAYYSRAQNPETVPVKDLREWLKFHFIVNDYFKKLTKDSPAVEETPPLLQPKEEREG